MIEQPICRACWAIPNRGNLEKLQKVVLTRPECREVNEHHCDPKYPMKGKAAKGRSLS